MKGSGLTHAGSDGSQDECRPKTRGTDGARCRSRDPEGQEDLGRRGRDADRPLVRRYPGRFRLCRRGPGLEDQPGFGVGADGRHRRRDPGCQPGRRFELSSREYPSPAWCSADFRQRLRISGTADASGRVGPCCRSPSSRTMSPTCSPASSRSKRLRVAPENAYRPLTLPAAARSLPGFRTLHMLWERRRRATRRDESKHVERQSKLQRAPSSRGLRDHLLHASTTALYVGCSSAPRALGLRAGAAHHESRGEYVSPSDAVGVSISCCRPG